MGRKRRKNLVKNFKVMTLTRNGINQPYEEGDYWVVQFAPNVDYSEPECALTSHLTGDILTDHINGYTLTYCDV